MDERHDFDRRYHDELTRDLPLGLGMAFMQNLTAFDAFSRLSDYEKNEFINGVRDVKTREEMRDYVLKLNDIEQKNDLI